MLFYLILAGLILPAEVTIVPLYYDLRDLGLSNTYWSVILPDIGTSVAFGTFWMRAFFLSAPAELAEAARIDGATTFGVLRRIFIPMARPAILTMALLVFVWTWNDFLLPLVMLQSPNLATAPLGISLFVQQYTTQEQELAAAALITAAPVVLLYIFLQRNFIRGMLSGALTG
jgi:raffinose/stachyose/melibiose transport system permease protein